MINIVVKDLLPEYRQAALEIVAKFYDEKIQREFIERFDASQSPQKGAYVVNYVGAFEGDTLVGIGGYAQSSMTDAYWELSWGTVLPEKQGQGVGKKLLEYRFQKILEKSTTPQTFAMISTKPTRLYLDAGFSKIENTQEPDTILVKQILKARLS